MTSIRSAARILVLVATFALSACASLQYSDPLQVTVAGIEPMQGEGMEVRFLVKLRVQNPNQAAIDYTGVYVTLDVQDKTFASGVSDAQGTVPGFGEAVVSVPVTVSVLRMVRQMMGMLDGRPVDKIDYVMNGKLNGGLFGTVRFQSQGEIKLPAASST